jgi:hypothetical protein
MRTAFDSATDPFLTTGIVAESVDQRIGQGIPDPGMERVTFRLLDVQQSRLDKSPAVFAGHAIDFVHGGRQPKK